MITSLPYRALCLRFAAASCLLLGALQAARAQPVGAAGESFIVRLPEGAAVAGVPAGMAGAMAQARSGEDFVIRFSGLNSAAPVFIEMGFADFDPALAPRRSMDISVNGVRALTAFNPASEAGGAFKTVVKRFSITPRAGEVAVRFRGSPAPAFVNYIRVTGSGDPVLATADIPDLGPQVNYAPLDLTDVSIRQEAAHAPWKSGVPLGGIGTGRFEILSNGSFANFTVFGNYDNPLPAAKKSFLAISAKYASGRGVARMLKFENPGHAELTGTDIVRPKSIKLAGRFPLAILDFEFDEEFPVAVRVKAWSPLVPHSIHDSAWPAAIIDVELENKRNGPVSTGVALSWENLIGLGSMEPGRGQGFRPVRHVDASTTHIEGILQSPAVELPPGAAANFAGECFIGVETTGVVVTRELEWQAPGGQPTWWRNFARRMRLSKRDPVKGVWQSTAETTSPNPASVLCATANLFPGERRQIRFYVTWTSPAYTPPGSSGQLRPAYLARFQSPIAVAHFLREQRPRLERDTAGWATLIARSSLPAWLRARQLNDLAPLRTNTVWFEGGLPQYLESPGAGSGSYADFAARPFWSPVISDLWPGAQREYLLARAAQQTSDGLLPRTFGNLHDPRNVPVADLDAAAAWAVEVARLARRTTDTELSHAAYPALMRVATAVSNEATTGAQALGPASAALRWVALNSARSLARDGGDTEGYEKLGLAVEAFRPTVRDALGLSIPGDAATTRSAFALAGPWLARMAAVAPVDSSASFAVAVRHFTATAMSAAAIAPIDTMGSDNRPVSPSSRLPLLQATAGNSLPLLGAPQTALDLLRHGFACAWEISRNPWAQSAAYAVATGRAVTAHGTPEAMSTWDIAAAFAGFSVDVPASTVYFRPNLPPEFAGELHVPVFTPGFWGWISHSEGASSSTLTILRVFPGYERVAIRRVVEDIEASGRPSGERLLARPAVLRAGRTIPLRRRPVEFSIE